MKQGRFSEEQIIGILKQNEAGAAVTQLCREHGIGESTFYKWNAAQRAPDTAAWKSTRPSGCGHWGTKTANSNDCWPMRAPSGQGWMMLP